MQKGKEEGGGGAKCIITAVFILLRFGIDFLKCLCSDHGRPYIKSYRSWYYILKCKSCLKHVKASMQMEVGFDWYASWNMSLN